MADFSRGILMTNAEYHAHPAISKSDLDLINRSPMHFKAAKENKKDPTDAMILGSVVHKLVLEPSTFKGEYAIGPDADKRTKAGKEQWKAFEESINDETIITSNLYNKAYEMSQAVLSNELAKKILTGGQAERSFFWNDIETGIECKCRPDYIKNGYVIDLKTTADASPEKFAKSAYDYRYHVQAWWYMNGLRNCGIKADKFIFIAVEKEFPYAVAIYDADELMLDLGRGQARKNLESYGRCLETGNFGGYSAGIEKLSLPDWLLRFYT